MPGEFDFIEWLANQPIPHTNPHDNRVLLGVGDDLAILRWRGDDLLLVGVDQVLDGVHFDSKVHAHRDIGAKVMNRNLSDCAAMACLPAAAVATVALPRGPRGAGLTAAQELYLGLRDAAAVFGCPVVGGDTASWDGPLALTVTILGRSAGIAPVSRAGARPGDLIYVTGALGGSILGRHMSFIPRVALARELAATGRVRAMIDISDGLSRDLGQICTASIVGAIVETKNIPIHADAQELSGRDGVSALEHALHDGEDHELLFCAARPITHPQAICIGRLTGDRGIMLDRGDGAPLEPLKPRGWEHEL